ncbi:MAG: hypothetical protein LUC22_07010 [Prevotella sp.]|nr:hypothetical protein [Prevotella sp.]
MNRAVTILVFIGFFIALPASAQNDNPAYRRGYDSDRNAVVESTRDFLGSTADRLQTSGKAEGEDVVKVTGKYYMPLYSVNLYKGDDGAEFRTDCKRLFAAKYPNAKIKSTAVPQTAWITEEVSKDNKTVGYTQTLYCYIIAEDGFGGYINARFAFKRYKDEGGKYTPLSEYSPKWERADLLSSAIYKKLLKR